MVSRVSETRALARSRRAARKLLAQSLYQLQLAEHPWQDVCGQFLAEPESAAADREYYKELLQAIAGGRAELDRLLAGYSDIEPARLDPVEHGILWLGLYELQHRPDVPYRVAISEAVELTKRFGATDGHKFVNAVLDRAASALRPDEARG